MKVDKAELQRVLEIVSPGLVAGKAELVEQSASFAFVNGRAVTYNDEISVSHPIENFEVQGAIKGDELYQLLDKITTEEITIEPSEGQIIIKAGKGKAGLALEQEIKLPLEEVDDKDWKDLPEGFTEAIRFVSSCCSVDISNPILVCIHIRKDGIIEACDNFRATLYRVDKLPVPSFLIPNSAAQQLIKYAITKIKIGKGWVHFKTEEDTVFSCRVFDDNYVDTASIFDMKKKPPRVELPKNTTGILDRAKVFAKQTSVLDEEVTVTIADNKLTIRGESASGWFEESADVKYSETPISLLVNPSFLQDVLGKVKQCLIIKDKIKFIGKDWEYVIALI